MSDQRIYELFEIWAREKIAEDEKKVELLKLRQKKLGRKIKGKNKQIMKISKNTLKILKTIRKRKNEKNSKILKIF